MSRGAGGTGDTGTGLMVHFSDMDDLILCETVLETALDARGSKVGIDGIG